MRNLLLFALSLAVSASAFADATAPNPAPNANADAPPSRSITLDVRNVSSGGSGGYTDVTVTTDDGNKKVYSYKYSGGDNDTGDVTFDKRGATTVVVHLRSDARYTIDDIKFPSDPKSQLSKAPNPAPTNVVIQNKNDEVQTATYKVTVKDSVANLTVPCDPMIINK